MRWLVEQRQLGLSVAGGEKGLDREIGWAHSIELADPRRWLRGGELLLTTGLRLPPGDGRRYLQRLAEAGVAALGFGVGLSHAAIPAQLVEAAGELALPVLEVPLRTPFVAIVRTVTDRLAEQEYEGVVRASRALPRMTRAALRGGPAAVVRSLVAATGSDVVLCAPNGNVLAAHPPAAANLPVRDDLAAACRNAGTTCSRAGAHGVVTVHPIRAGRRVRALLVLAARRDLASADHLLIGHAVSLIAMEQEGPPGMRETRRELSGLVLSLVLEGDLDAAKAERYLRLAGLPVGDELVVLAIRGPLVAVPDLPHVAAARDGYAVVVLPGDPAVEQWLREIRRTGGTPAIGLARTSVVSGLAAAARKADVAAGVAQAQRKTLVEFDALAGRILAGHPQTRAVLHAVAETRLRPLAEVDEAGGTALVMTLQSFLEHHGQWEAASAALGVHRHTLRNRMERIQELLGTDLASAHVRAELLLALTAWRPSHLRSDGRAQH
ncbi:MULTISPECIES: PucR family transcriptional regulator [Amycolatopsis]|uniref:PucR family transcriptional regulator n=1 Tax=Amycolatopsis TaxID=1813 RepID=UPI0007E25E33|nr:PucR family transcriptional regulator [Amycolatopsis sp. M39]OAP25513.1 carbohydrate diacid transcriptional activator CdaR [Amycolatopsis sp. M39]